MQWKLAPGMTPQALGYLPSFLSENDPRPAREQLDSGYRQFGGWQPFLGPFAILPNGDLRYPGDPDLPPLAETELRGEEIRVYPGDWVAIIQPDGSFEICRMD